LPRRPVYDKAKRALDVAVAVAVGLTILPALAVVAVAIRIDSDGPVLLRQWRSGRNGRPFPLLKFRSMRIGQPPNEALVDLNVMHGPTFKAPDDPRVTRVGRFIRRTSLDEVPQLWNVLRGEMSLVGPRPLVLEEDAQLPEHARLRAAVRPGMTGAWQVAGRSLVPFDEWMALDLEYVQSRGMRRDLEILARTPHAVLSRRGAY
jgi:lipopolysaccharide/colanic/teichoic acid biosynthesis glycosyltransferase